MESMGKSEKLDFVFSISHFYMKAPWLYKIIVILTVVLFIIACFYTLKIYRDNQRYHDFSMSEIHVFVEKDYNERTLSFAIENLNDGAVYVDQIRLVVYDNQSKEVPLFSLRKYAGVNPLSKGEKLKVLFILDNKTIPEIDFAKIIHDHEYMVQSYKFIIVAYYNKNSSASVSEQRFEYIYRVICGDEGIVGTIMEVPSQRNETKIIEKNIPYSAT